MFLSLLHLVCLNQLPTQNHILQTDVLLSQYLFIWNNLFYSRQEFIDKPRLVGVLQSCPPPGLAL